MQNLEEHTRVEKFVASRHLVRHSLGDGVGSKGAVADNVYKIIISYDGTDFHGWQEQPIAISIQSCLKKSFESAFKCKVSILGASRTDAGVHALGQVARVRTTLDLPPETIIEVWNRQLPKSIFIRSIDKVSDDFHPLYNVAQKTYYYHLFLKQPLPFVARFGWHFKFIDSVDFDKFERAVGLYIGKHDFASFCKQDKGEERTTIREVYKISLKRISKFNVVRVEITVKSFLRFQIRRMIGYALDVARRKDLPISFLKDMLDNPNPNQSLTKAEGGGLCLRKVVYK